VVFLSSGRRHHHLWDCRASRETHHLVSVKKDENGGSGAIRGWSCSVSAKMYKEMNEP
jgi:hypothetical protein